MKMVTLTVNGERQSANVEARTQLAELLRDHFHLTGTHLGCEQGVCGACTVVADGRPIRSCITYAHACDGAQIETIEGFGADPIASALRDAFSRHHALQCGFCTPGMLITARDMVARLGLIDEVQIRRELSGNLCRCTGYMGIVAAVKEVANEFGGQHADALGTASPAPVSPQSPLEPFEIDPVFASQMRPQAASQRPSSTDGDGWTLIEREFDLAHTAMEVWRLFADLPRVAPCLPGVTAELHDDENFTSSALIRFGPIAASFDGSGTVSTNPQQHSGRISGNARDPNGQSSLDAALAYQVLAGQQPADARVKLEFRFRIQGTLAQFNRGDLVQSFADVMLAEFIGNCDRVLTGEVIATKAELSGLRLLWRLLLSKLNKR